MSPLNSRSQIFATRISSKAVIVAIICSAATVNAVRADDRSAPPTALDTTHTGAPPDSKPAPSTADNSKTDSPQQVQPTSADTPAPVTPTENVTPAPSASQPAAPSVTAATAAPTAAAKKDATEDKPPPKGQDVAVKLYSQRKFIEAAKMFEGFINNGTADTNTHAYYAYCLYNTKRYSKALAQWRWVVDHAKSVELKRSAENSMRMLQGYMRGVCPGNCLKANDPRFGHYSGLDPQKRWIKFSRPGGWTAVSDEHVGQLLVTDKDGTVHPGDTCPTCGGTGTVPVLRDGQPLPH